VLDLLKETCMLWCKPAVTPIDQKTRLCAEAVELVDRERYQRLIGHLICLSHTRPNISFTVNMVSRYMHDPRKCHMNAVYQIFEVHKECTMKEVDLPKEWSPEY
jgi:hypothetical protein